MDLYLSRSSFLSLFTLVRIENASVAQDRPLETLVAQLLGDVLHDHVVVAVLAVWGVYQSQVSVLALFSVDNVVLVEHGEVDVGVKCLWDRMIHTSKIAHLLDEGRYLTL